MSVLDFLLGKAGDNSGRTLDQILSQDDSWLEADHSYIQWLFPLLEESQQVHDAPVLVQEDVQRIKDNPLAIQNHRKALTRMLKFYSDNDQWLVPMDHNHLRITRILKSVRLLHSLERAEEVYNFFMERAHIAGNPIQSRNVAFWTDAVGLSYSRGWK